MFVGKFTDFYRDVTKKGTKISQEEYKEIGSYPIIDQGKKLIAGRWDNREGVFDDVPAIIFGDHTRAIKYIEEPFFIGADGVKILRPTNAQDSTKYLYYALQAARIPNLGYSRHFKALKELEIRVYSREEQDEIVRVLDKIDHLIEQRYKEISCLNQLVKSRFVELFGDIIHNDRRWSECLFSEITSSRLGKMLDAKHQTGRYAFPYLANANVQWFKIETDDLNQMDFNETDQIEFSLKDGDLLVCEGGEIGRCAVWHDQVQPCYFQKALHRVRCNQETILPDYLAWWFKFNCDYNGFAAIEGAKATIAHLTGAKLKKLKVVVPPVELQKIFVDFVKQVDKSKLAVQKSLDELETLKKSLMQQYFG